MAHALTSSSVKPRIVKEAIKACIIDVKITHKNYVGDFHISYPIRYSITKSSNRIPVIGHPHAHTSIE